MKDKAYSSLKYKFVELFPGIDCRLSSALAINNKGQIAIAAVNTTVRSFLRTDGKLTEIKSVEPRSNCWVGGLNEHGTVVGTIGYIDDARAFVWKNGKMTLLPSLSRGTTYARGVTNDELIFGVSYDGNGISHAVLWKDGAIIDVGSKIARTDTFFSGVSTAGPAVGHSSTRGEKYHLYLSGRSHGEASRNRYRSLHQPQ
ncbi:MAG: hypothetical protein QM758_07000 [Armatimonas sp.]